MVYNIIIDLGGRFGKRASLYRHSRSCLDGFGFHFTTTDWADFILDLYSTARLVQVWSWAPRPGLNPPFDSGFNRVITLSKLYTYSS